ncbi:hypothetical protein CEXT_679361 [Caerostris extrusa]|uniref:Uncharacterized protein n=1 Tax=Caerostris extrusa TaxID=172846 RepID=A0AAV4SN54_CAEEX|nr:hypothetical protein CEXT_679361 [Caerostris extrusa]
MLLICVYLTVPPKQRLLPPAKEAKIRRRREREILCKHPQESSPDYTSSLSLLPSTNNPKDLLVSLKFVPFPVAKTFRHSGTATTISSDHSNSKPSFPVELGREWREDAIDLRVPDSTP